MILFLFLVLLPIDELYNQGKYFDVIEQAEKSLQACLGGDTSLTIEDRVGIHTILAFSYIALGKDRLAKLEFLEALALEPELELDPVLTSPKIIKVFQSARATFRLSPNVGADYNLPLPKKDLLAFIMPGTWDIRTGNKKRGYFLAGTSVISILSLGVSHYQCEKYHRVYLDAKEIDEINNTYNTYSLWYKSRTLFLASTILTYTINLIILAM